MSTAGGALLVLGNRKGDVVAFNTVLGDMAWRAQGCHTGCVQRLFTRPALFNVMVQQEVRQVMTKPEINPYYTEAQAEADTFTSDILMSPPAATAPESRAWLTREAERPLPSNHPRCHRSCDASSPYPLSLAVQSI